MLQWHLSACGISKVAREHFVFEVDALGVGKIGTQKNLSDFDSGKIIIARQLSRIISKIAGAVEYSRSVVVHKNWSDNWGPGKGVLGVKISQSPWKSYCMPMLTTVYDQKGLHRSIKLDHRAMQECSLI